MTTARFAHHGSVACAKGRPTHNVPPCTQPRCLTAQARYQHRVNLYRSHPAARYDTIPAQPVTAHLRRLLTEGAGWAQITSAAECSTSTIKRLLNDPADIDTDAACRILALRPEDALAPCKPVPAVGSMRRVRALAAIGHQRAAISATAQVANEVVGELLNGTRKAVDPRTADRIAAAYERMRWTAGPSVRMRNRGRREGWATPFAWDGNIDDPAAEPDLDGAVPQRVNRDDQALVIAEEIRHLAGFGLSSYEIARRVGRSEKYVREQIAGRRGPGWRDAKPQTGEAA